MGKARRLKKENKCRGPHIFSFLSSTEAHPASVARNTPCEKLVVLGSKSVLQPGSFYVNAQTPSIDLPDWPSCIRSNGHHGLNGRHLQDLDRSGHFEVTGIMRLARVLRNGCCCGKVAAEPSGTLHLPFVSGPTTANTPVDLKLRCNFVALRQQLCELFGSFGIGAGHVGGPRSRCRIRSRRQG